MNRHKSDGERQLDRVRKGNPALGLRIRRYRDRLRLDRGSLAHQIGRSQGWLLKVENGRTDILYTDLVKLADRLNVEVEKLLRDTEDPAAEQPAAAGRLDAGMMEDDPTRATGDPSEWLEEMRRRAFLRAAATLTGATAAGWWPSLGEPCHSALSALRDVLVEPDAWTEADARPADLVTLRRSVHGLWSALQHSRYSGALAMLPATLREATHARRVLNGDEKRAASVLLAQTYQAVTTLMRKVGDLTFAAIAADRAMAAAHLDGSAVALTDSARFACLSLGDGGHHRQAIETCTAAASRFESEERRPGPTALSIYGQLILAGAEAAAQSGDATLSRDFFDSAVGVSRRLGADGNHGFTAFGPCNIAVHRVHASVVLRDGEGAVRHARTVALNRLPAPERRARYLLDVALGYNLVGKPEDAAVSLLEAEGVAAEEIRYDPASRLLVEQLRHRGRSLSVQLDALAERLPRPPA